MEGGKATDSEGVKTSKGGCSDVFGRSPPSCKPIQTVRGSAIWGSAVIRKADLKLNISICSDLDQGHKWWSQGLHRNQPVSSQGQ